LAEPIRAGEMFLHLEGYPEVADWQTCGVDSDGVVAASEGKSIEEALRSLGYIE